MPRIDGIPNAAASAVAGIRRASDDLDDAAAEVSRGAFALGDPVSISDQAREAPSGSEVGDLAKAMVDLRVARYEVAANVAVLRTVDEVTRDLVNIAAPRRR